MRLRFNPPRRRTAKQLASASRLLQRGYRIGAPLLVPMTVLKKVVWLLWMQGWEQAPWLVRGVYKSYRFCAPDWEVVRLDMDSLPNYTALPSYLGQKKIRRPAKSDIIRLALLASNGGLWADATLLCMRKLDDWLPAALAQPSGFWT